MQFGSIYIIKPVNATVKLGFRFVVIVVSNNEKHADRDAAILFAELFLLS